MQGSNVSRAEQKLMLVAMTFEVYRKPEMPGNAAELSRKWNANTLISATITSYIPSQQYLHV